MIVHPLARKALKVVSNFPGWRTKRRILVIESDDWGGVRMPSRAAYGYLAAKGVDVSGEGVDRYNKFDTLESGVDLMALFDVLSSFRTENGTCPVITAVCVVANPDFGGIRKSNYQRYVYEPFSETYRRFPNGEKSMGLWFEGISQHLFAPQFHGREHLNVEVWLRALQSGDSHTRLAFDRECWGFNNVHPSGIQFQSAFDLEYLRDLDKQIEILGDGLNVFEQIFGFRASYFVPPNGPISNKVIQSAYVKGIKYVSSAKIRREALGEGKTRIRFHYLGQRNSVGQTYITRNCFFEPSDRTVDWVSRCIEEIDLAFHCQKPAVISSHRVNYVGGLFEENRAYGLSQLRKLLVKVLRRWPDVEFMSSTELGKLISK